MKQHVPEVLPEVQHIDLEELPVTKKEPEVQQHVEPKILPVPEAVPEVPQHTEPKAELDADAELGPTSQVEYCSLGWSDLAFFCNLRNRRHCCRSGIFL